MPCALRRCAPCLGNCRFCRWLLLLARSQPLASFLLIFYVFFHIFFHLTVMDSRVVADGRMESWRPRPCRPGTSSVPSFWFFWSVSFWPGSHWIQKGTVCTACSCSRSGCRAEREVLEHTQQRLPQVRMCIRVRNVSPECSTWLSLGSWGWGRLHSNVGHPKSKRENANLVDRNHISTHRFSGQKMGGEALVPHSLHDLGSRSSPPHLVQLSHWLALLWPPFEMLVSWHPAF